MAYSYSELVPIIKAISDETRLKIIDILSCGEMCACDILELVNVSQSTLSYHMKMLTESRLVNGRKDGSWMRYSINKENAELFLSNLNNLVEEKEKNIDEEKNQMNKPKVAFICVHNSCRSQMAEAISKIFAGDVYEAYSAGTETKDRINQDAVKIIKELYNVDMEESQSSKLIDTLPAVDIVITMGCNVDCPWLPSRHREDWGLDDPSGLSKEEFIKTAKIIEEKVLDLKERINYLL